MRDIYVLAMADQIMHPNSPLAANPRLASLLKFARLLLAAATLCAIGRQLTLHVGAGYSVLNFFSYFTNLSNIFAALVLMVSVSSMQRQSIDVMRYLSTVNMTIVGVVFSVLLRNVDLGDLLAWVNFVLHYLMPVAIVLDWLLDPPVSKLGVRHAFIALSFPAIYLVYVIIRGGNTGWYPYPFLNPSNVQGYGAVARYSLGIGVVFALASWLLLGVGNRRSRAQPGVTGI